MADIQYNRRQIGDRKEGRRLRTLAPFYKLMPYIMKVKSDASNQFEDSVEISTAERWLRAKRTEGYKGLGLLHLFIAAYLRVCASRPAVNRFVSGQKVYARNSVEVIMAIKPELSSDSNETSIKVPFSPADTVYDVYHKLGAAIDGVKAANTTGTTKAATAFTKIPGLFLKFTIWLLTLLDYFDLLPAALLRVSPFHGSIVVTDLGSLGIPPIYHHLYNFGNCPAFLAFGIKRRAVELDKAGLPVERKYVDYRLVLDERICDGHYYASAFKYLKRYLLHPEELEQPPERVEQDIF